MLSEEEILELERFNEIDTPEYEKKNSNSLFKLPIFQPTAAAAMMYNMQNVTVQREMQKQLKTVTSNELNNNSNEINKLFNTNLMAENKLYDNTFTSIILNENFDTNTENLNKSGLF